MFVLSLNKYIEEEWKRELGRKEIKRKRMKDEMKDGVDLTKRNVCDQKEAGKT
jgi:hypothetical protein